MTGEHNDQILRTGPAARFASVTPQTIRRWCDIGLLPFHLSPTGQRRIWRSDLTAVMNAPPPQSNVEASGPTFESQPADLAKTTTQMEAEAHDQA